MKKTIIEIINLIFPELIVRSIQVSEIYYMNSNFEFDIYNYLLELNIDFSSSTINTNKIIETIIDITGFQIISNQ